MTNKNENATIRFTILPSNAGFTDQLLQFSTFYKLGVSLGYEYTHSNFVNTRPGAEDIFDFLGFNEHFPGNRLTQDNALYRRMGTDNRFSAEPGSWHHRLRRKLLFRVISGLFYRDFNFIDIGLGETAPLEEGKDPVEALRVLIRDTVKRNRSDTPGRQNLVRFHLTSGKFFFQDIAPLLNQQSPCFPDNLDLRSTYYQLRESEPAASRFSDNTVKVLVHIRLGDTAMIETPWQSIIPLWAYWCINPLKEYSDKSDRMFRKLMDVEDFVRFLEKFSALFTRDEVSTAVFSDGYRTAFNDLFAKLDGLQLSSDRAQALRQSAQGYEQRKFSMFDEFDNCACCVGETNRDLQALVHAALEADVIIVGCHQRMIPKFLATYYDTRAASPPAIIALHNGIEPRYREEIGLSKEKACVYPVNLADAAYIETLPGIVEAIRQRRSVVADADTLNTG